MPLAAIFAIVFALGAGSGGFAAYRIQEAKVLKMEMAINNANAQSLLILNTAKTKVNEANIEALNLNRELEDANKIHVETINHYYDALHNELAKRVRTSDSTSCADTVPKSSGTGSIKETTTSKNRFSEEFITFLEEQLRLADEVANYAWIAYQFTSANCGIK